MTIHLKAHDNQYVCAEQGGGSSMVANRNQADMWETFELASLDRSPIREGSRVALRSYFGYYVCAGLSDDTPIRANQTTLGPRETFTISELNGGAIRDGSKIALRASNGKYVRAEGGGGRELLANRDKPGPWETFTLETNETVRDLNTAVDRFGRLPAVVPESTSQGPPSQTTVDVNGVAYQVTDERRRLVSDVVEHAFLQDISLMGIWPGEAIQGRALLQGDIAPIGPFTRAPGTIQIVTDLISHTPHPQSVEVSDPDAANVNQARRDILHALRPSDSSGLLKAEFERAYTLREVGIKLGLNVKGSAFGVDANAALDQTHRRSVVVGSIRQVFYAVTFTPGSAGATGFWPSGRVSYQDLERYAGAGNPPLYVDSVQFGRFICIAVQGTFDSSEIAGALKASWQMAVSGSATVDARSKEILENTQIKVYTVGVPGHGSFQDLADPLNGLQEVYKSGLSFSLNNPGAPISFTCRHIADNSLAHVGLAAEYTQALVAQGEDVKGRTFEVFDGPGGGLVDTRIPVNPGDAVTISAGGMVWSGVIFSGLHGPEGWPGHKADSAAPLSSGTAYCLIARFGNGKWIEVGRSWQGSPNGGQAGPLQLNINDNNPYNGDPAKRWSVTVDVKRAGAGAVGIYI